MRDRTLRRPYSPGVRARAAQGAWRGATGAEHRRGSQLHPQRRARFPEDLQARFKGRRFVEADPPDFLDHEVAEILLIGAGQDVSEELGLTLDPQRETEATAETFNDLGMERSRHPVAPLFEGTWK